MNPAALAPDECFETASPVALPERVVGTNGEVEVMADASDMETVEPPPAAIPRVMPGHRALPHSLDAEEHVLSCCLIDGSDTLARCIEAKFRPDFFYDPRHGTIYETLLAMHADGIPLDASTLAEELIERGKLAEVGGFPFITQVSARAPTSIQAAYFIRKVRDLATRREIIRAATHAVEDCYDHSGELSELTGDLTRRLTFAIEGRAARSDWPIPVASDELCANPPPIPPELIEGILFEGGTMLISGPSKSHKTFTALDAGIAIASGDRWLGFKTTKSIVLYLNLELQAFASTERISKICAARGHAPPHDLKVWNLRGKTISLSALTVQLPSLIKQFSAKVVCVDPHYKISCVSGMEENSNDNQGELLTLLEGLCASEGAALINTHHFAKGDSSVKNAIDRASGGGVFARWGDVMLTFTPHEDDDCMTVEMALRNFAPVEPFVVRWEYPRWQRDDLLDPALLKRSANRGSFQEKYSPDILLECLGDKLLTATEWLDASGLSDRTFFRKRKELTDSGKVILESGCYRVKA